MNEYGLTYTLDAPGGQMIFNPPGHNQPGYYLLPDGIEFGAEVRASAEGRGEAHGSNIDNSFEEGLVGALQYLVVGTNVAERHQLIDNANMVMRSLLGEEGTGTLTWTPADGSASRRVRELRVTQRRDTKGSDGILKQQNIGMQSPRSTAESAAETLLTSSALSEGGGGLTFPMTFPITFQASAGGSLIIPHIGTATAYPVLEIHGRITTPQIVNLLTGERLAFSGEIAAGDWLEVDLFNRTVKLNGTVNRRNLRSRSTWTWFGIAAKTNVPLALVGGSWDASARLKVRMRDAFAS